MSHGIRAMDSLHLMITLICVFPLTPGSLCYQFRVPSGFPSQRKYAVYSKEKNGLFGLRHSICRLCFLTAVLNIFCPEHSIFYFPAAGISATSEDIPNKIEDLRSECSSDFGGKDSVTSPDGEESGHGRRVSHSRYASSAISPVSIGPCHCHSC